MRQTLGIIVLLMAVPFLRADTVQVLQVTSGVIEPLGSAGSDNTTLSGTGFTAVGILNFEGSCPSTVASGQPILGCGSGGLDFFSGGLVLTLNGTTESVFFNDDFGTTFTQDPMLLSGATQATLSEPATISPLIGCIAPMCAGLPNENLIRFVINGNVQFNVSLTQGTQLGGYDVTNEEYTIRAAEPGTVSLLMLGLGFLGLLITKCNMTRLFANS